MSHGTYPSPCDPQGPAQIRSELEKLTRDSSPFTETQEPWKTGLQMHINSPKAEPTDAEIDETPHEEVKKTDRYKD